jgi:phosphoribosylaminoimidazole-succinocarboxamide synthase
VFAYSDFDTRDATKDLQQLVWTLVAALNALARLETIPVEVVVRQYTV